MENILWFCSVLCAHVAQGKCSPAQVGEMFESELAFQAGEDLGLNVQAIRQLWAEKLREAEARAKHR